MILTKFLVLDRVLRLRAENGEGAGASVAPTTTHRSASPDGAKSPRTGVKVLLTLLLASAGAATPLMADWAEVEATGPAAVADVPACACVCC